MMSDMSYVDDDLARRVTAALVELQGEQSNTAFAASLGCTRTHWWCIRRGRRRPSYELIKRAAQRYPVLHAIVMRDLMSAEQVPAAQSDRLVS
jgi:hypothetical protein